MPLRLPRRPLPLRVPALLLAAALALAGCSGGGDDIGTPTTPSPPATSPGGGRSDPAQSPELARYYTQRPRWSDCEGGLRCAKVTVPLDWSQPGGTTIELALARRAATGDRVGTLLFNPGGPGVPTVPYLKSASSLFGARVLDAYDVVGWDTRGVGRSASIRCLPNDRLDAFFSAETSPDDAAEVREVTASTREYARACEKNTGPLLAHVDTLSTVRDMDVIRAVVGDKVLNLYGASYGTYLGSWYAQTFPWRVGRLVLDGAVDPSLDAAGYTEGQALGFSRAVRAYVKDCLAGRDCPLRGTQDEAYAQLGDLVARADATPLRTSSGRPLTQALMTTGLAQGMYLQELWPAVSKGVGEALQGDGTTLLALADAYNRRDDKGAYGPEAQATGPMFCLDHAETRTPAQIADAARVIAKKYPPLGDSIGWAPLSCALWPIEAVVPAQKLTAVGAAPILVIGTTDDPATPYEWAQSLASQLTSGVLVTRVGQGHTGYLKGNRCVDTAVERYLVTGSAPATDLTCS